MSIGLISVSIATLALVVLAFVSFINVQKIRVQIWYVFLASFFAGIVFIVGLNSELYSILLLPLMVMIHVVTKVMQISKKI